MGEYIIKRVMSQSIMEVLLQDDETAIGNGFEAELNGVGARLSVSVRWNPGTTGGRVVVESASSIGFTGKWAEIERVNASPDSESIVVFEGPVGAVRARISTTVTGGATPGVTAKLLTQAP